MELIIGTILAIVISVVVSCCVCMLLHFFPSLLRLLCKPAEMFLKTKMGKSEADALERREEWEKKNPGKRLLLDFSSGAAEKTTSLIPVIGQIIGPFSKNIIWRIIEFFKK